MQIARYTQGADLPDLTIEWTDENDQVIDFSTGHTFELRIGYLDREAQVTKTSGITGDDVLPNVRISWATTAELNNIDPALYTADLLATRTSDSKQRLFRFPFRVLPAVL